MRKRKNKINLLSVKKETRSSRFVVDLKEEADINEEEKAYDYKKKELFLSKIEKILEIEFRKTFLLYHKKFIDAFVKSFSRNKKNVSEKVLVDNNENLKSLDERIIVSDDERENKDEEVTNFSKKLLNTLSSGRKAVTKTKDEFSSPGLIKIKNILNAYSKKLENLAFFSLFIVLLKFIFSLFSTIYKFSYRIGWVAIFIVKFIYFSSTKFSVGVYKIIKKYSSSLLETFKGAAKKLDKLSLYIVANLKRLAFLIKKRTRVAVEVYRKEDSLEEPIFIEGESLEKEKTIWTVLRPIISFSIILLILILPFKAYTSYKSLDLNALKGRVLGVTEVAVNDFMLGAEGATGMDFKKANDNFSKAGDNFIKAQEHLEDINGMIFSLASIIPREEIKMASISRDILSAGESASSLGVYMSQAFNNIFESDDKNLIEIIDNFAVNAEKAGVEAKKLNSIFIEIDLEVLPLKYRDKFKDLKEKTIDLERGLSGFNEIVESLKIFLGANKDKRYLVVFQNNTELRASGGFIGSYALVDLRDGKIRNMEVPTGGGYDTKAGLTEFIAAPEPLHLVNPLWHFWDANWWPDWGKSAKKLMWFYERSDGPTVDGVISITPTVIEKLLSAIGPIDMSEDYGVILDSENFWITTQAIAEEKLTKEQELAGEKHESKKIIGDLINKILEELPKRLNKEVLLKALQATESSLSEKHILFYFNDLELQNKIEEYGWAGKVEDTKLDYLSVINTNIAGGKSDRRMKEDINLEVDIKPDGTVINSLTIKRTHTGIKREPFSGVRNVNWMRIYVPSGSELLEVSGFRVPDEIYFEDPDMAWKKDKDVYAEELNSSTHEKSGTKVYKEDNKTVFANWSMVDPGEEVTIYLKYKLPFKIKEKKEGEAFMRSLKNFFNPSEEALFPYSLLSQKQPGSMPSNFSLNILLPYNYNTIWQYPKRARIEDYKILYNDSLDGDKYFATLLENKD